MKSETRMELAVPTVAKAARWSYGPPHFTGWTVGLGAGFGASPSGKAPVFGIGIRRFESSRPSHPDWAG